MPPGIMTSVRALMHFCYLVQSPHIDDDNLAHISAALDEFHVNKHAIITAGVCHGKGNTTIDNWYIPKLKLMQNIVPSICSSGIIGQWSANATEHAHITEVKNPARSTNNNNYAPQICCYLDRADKCNRFDLAIDLLDGKLNDDIDEDADVEIVAVEIPSSAQQPDQPPGSIPIPLCSFVVGRTALHLAYDPSIRNISVDEVAVTFNLPDLCPAIADFLHREETSGHRVHAISGPQRAGPEAELPFDKLQVWFKICLQETDFHNAHKIHPAQTLNCAPPSEPWTSGCYDTVIIQTNTEQSWPTCGLSGHSVAQLRLLIWPIGKSGIPWSWEDQFITYLQQFDISSERDPTTQLHVLRRSKRSNGSRMGDIIPVSQLRAPVHFVPRFSATADTHFTAYNSMEHASKFWLNYFWDKNSFFALSA
ncbi:uncharacterized protein EDB93DRAFT_1253055 [Suillus bovinus]|uniref:uncharacterized protein n=1 Tax=Suillus bovinus TaxID=48563 RepID=UPI001B864766|nr:uncharacterized protein EDB93DRAFT_1253055 [Suillus bovinus]KAG2139639.1 hypothetical protein EDB93DRAFT_1253055 [Suillus bovinus]